MKLQAKRDSGVGAISNKSSEHFNIISLKYNNTPEGGKLQQKVSGAWQCAGGCWGGGRGGRGVLHHVGWWCRRWAA
jgi:hypothetical protein